MPFAVRPWAVIVASGDAYREALPSYECEASTLARTLVRVDCARSPLRDVFERASSITDGAHTLIVVDDAHRRLWARELPDRGDAELLVQPDHTGTAVAILQAINELLERHRDPYLLVLSSDHEVADERTWSLALRRALEAAEAAPEQVVLIGVPPVDDRGQDWIVPGPRAVQGTYPVLGFFEQPGPLRAARLRGLGALRSTSTFAASAQALLRVFMRHGEDMLERYSDALVGHASFELFGADLPTSILGRDFVRDILERGPEDVRVLPCPDCGWTDRDAPERAPSWIAHRPRGGARPPGASRDGQLLS